MRKFFMAAVLSVFTGFSGCGNEFYGGDALYPPAIPSGLSVKDLDESTVTIQWTDNADNESGYNIERSVNGGEYILVISTDPDETEFEEALPDDTIYSYRVHSFNSAGNSDTTKEINVKRPRTARAVITTGSGGTVNLTDIATAAFPPGSFSSDETVAAIEGVNEESISAGRYPYLGIVSDIRPLTIVDFTAKGLSLKKNINLIMNYDPQFLDKLNSFLEAENSEPVARGYITRADADKMKVFVSDLDIYFFNVISNKWVKTNAVADPDLHTLTVSAPYLGIYCVGYSLAVKTGFSLEGDPELQRLMIDKLDSFDRFLSPDTGTEKPGEACSASCGKSVNPNHVIMRGVYDGYHNNCHLCPEFMDFNQNGKQDIGEPDSIPASGVHEEKDLGCDNCTTPGDVTDMLSGYIFTPACANHDCCYRHGYATYGRKRIECNSAFLVDMLSIARHKFPLWERSSYKIPMIGKTVHIWWSNPLNLPRLTRSVWLAYEMFNAVSLFSPEKIVAAYDLQPCFDYLAAGVNCKIPRLYKIEASREKCEPGESIAFTPVFKNPDERTIRFEWSTPKDSIDNPLAMEIRWTAPPSVPVDTEFTITLAITDGINVTPTKTKTVTVLKPYTITYDPNNATGGMPPAGSGHNYYGSACYAEQNYGNLARKGYYFAGWNTRADGSGFDRPEFGFFIMGEEDITFYAKWLPAYTVEYRGNGNTGGEVPVDPANYKPGMSAMVQHDSNLVKTGFYFAGWNTGEDGSGTDIGNYYVIQNADAVFYAKWLPVYSVEYRGNGNTGGNAPSDAGRYQSGAIVSVTGNTGGLVNAGRLFTGWNTEPDGSGDDRGAGGTFTMGSSNIILYAKWSEYPVTYNGNGSTGGSVPVDTAEHIVGDTVLVKNNTGSLVRDGHTFSGWNTSPDGDGTDYSAGAVFRLSRANITLYAKWSAHSYAVTFNSMGGSPAALQMVEHGSKASYPVSKKGGYDLAGWTPDGSNLWAFDVSPVTENMTLYALWIRHVYNLRETGPAGGLIFYDKGSVSGGWQYLETAPCDQGQAQWSNGNSLITGATGTSAGAGRLNTSLIIYYQGAGSYPAGLCDNLVVVNDGITYNDWFLPSKDELWQIGWNLCGVQINANTGGVLINPEVPEGGIGGFFYPGDGSSGEGVYWSSSEYNADNAYHHDLRSGASGYSAKSKRFRVRAVRAF